MGGWSGEQGGIDNMGKDIDRNITRQLWERFKNVFTRNDVIPVENGGTGETNLDLFYPKLVQDERVTRIMIANEALNNGFTLQSDSDLQIVLNKKSLFLEGIIHVKRDSGITSDNYFSYNLQNGGYNIKRIRIAPYRSEISILDNLLILYGDFNEKNEYKINFNTFFPFV